MGKNIRIDFLPTGTTHNVYTGLSLNSINDIVCSGSTVFCDFAAISDPNVEVIYVKITGEGCHDQIYKVYLKDVITFHKLQV